MSPEVFAVKKISKNFLVALNPSDFCARLNLVLEPKQSESSASGVKPVYIKMGFPIRSLASGGMTKCCCHSQLQSATFSCPQCLALVCEIPTNCPACKLTLVDKDMLARVHRLLYDMPDVDIVAAKALTCTACNDTFSSKTASRCSACSQVFCPDCDAFKHDSLKHCLGCLS
jgi:transcription initiation factor TFIIH subunit 2